MPLLGYVVPALSIGFKRYDKPLRPVTDNSPYIILPRHRDRVRATR